MSVVSAIELRGSGGNNRKGYATFVRRWLVETDDPLDGPYVASDFPGHPTYGEGYGAGNDLYGSAVLTEFRMEPVEGQLTKWIATCTYSSEPQETGTGNLGSNDGSIATAPTNPSQQSGGTSAASRTWSVKFGAKEYTERMDRDANGDAVVTKAKQPIPCEVTRYRPTIHISGWSVATAETMFMKVEELVGSVNYDSFLGYAPQTLLCTSYQPTSSFDNGAYCWQVEVELELNRDGWNQLKLLNAGTIANLGGGETGPIADASGQPIQAPHPLDTDGYKLESGEPNYVTFAPYTPAYFASIIP